MPDRAAIATTFGLREARQRREADQARTDLIEVVRFQSDMLANVDPGDVGRELFADLLRRVADAEGYRPCRIIRSESRCSSRLAGLPHTADPKCKAFRRLHLAREGVLRAPMEPAILLQYVEACHRGVEEFDHPCQNGLRNLYNLEVSL